MKIAFTVFCTIIALTFLYLFFIATRSRKKNDMTGLTVDYAHRGLHGNDINGMRVPENSLEAFRLAIENGFGIELDVRQSADGTVYVFHDDNLKRLCGVDKKFSEMSDNEISQLHLDNTIHTIPSLVDVLTLVDGRVPLLIELKGEMGDKTLCPTVAEILLAYRGRFCIESFNSFLIGWFKKHHPSICRGQLYTDVKAWNSRLRLLSIYANSMMMNYISRPDFIAYNIEHEDKPLLQLCLKIFKPYRFVWTVKDLSTYDKYKSDEKITGTIFEKIIPDSAALSGMTAYRNEEN